MLAVINLDVSRRFSMAVRRFDYKYLGPSLCIYTDYLLTISQAVSRQLT